jgi:hypothetical protein
MKSAISILFFVTQFLCFGNMAKPYTDATEHSVLFSSEKLKVVKESIRIKVFSNGDSDDFDEGFYSAKFNITYEIYSEQAIKLPLLFIGLGAPWADTIDVNGIRVKETTAKNSMDTITMKAMGLRPSHREGLVEVSFAENEMTYINLDNLIYFEANLNEGLNLIHVVYTVNMGSNNYGFIRYHNIQYSLYPSQFWQSFGPIRIDLELPDTMTVSNASIGSEDSIQNNHYYYTITKIPTEDLKLAIGPKISIASHILLALHPFGIALVLSLMLVMIHFRLIKKFRQKRIKRFNWYLLIGNFLIPVLYYVFFFLSFGLIHLTLGYNSLNRHGYIFLLAVTWPAAWLFYSLIMWIADSHWKEKYGVDL